MGSLRGVPREGLVQGWRNRGQRLGCLGRQAGSEWVAETRETGKGPEPGRRLAHDPSGEPSNRSIENSEEPKGRLLGARGIAHPPKSGFRESVVACGTQKELALVPCIIHNCGYRRFNLMR